MDLQFQTNAPNGDFLDHGLKILNGFIKKSDRKTEKELLAKYYDKGIAKKPFQFFRNILRMATFDHTPKIHEIVKDSKKWAVGKEIRFIYKQGKTAYEFAPEAVVSAIQTILIKKKEDGVSITIGTSELSDDEMLVFAKNEGFVSVEKLVEYYFYESEETEFSSTLIHWTDLIY